MGDDACGRQKARTATPAAIGVSAFLAWLLVFSAPFWILGSAIAQPEWFPCALPLGALMFCAPTFAALWTAHLAWGFRGGMKRLLCPQYASSPRPKWTRIFIFAVSPGLAVVVGSLVDANAQVLVGSHVQHPLILTAGLVVAALLEEIGWMRALFPALRVRLGEPVSAISMGLIWAVWHFVPLLQFGAAADYFMWWTLGTVALRVHIVRLYEMCGRMIVVALLAHATFNVAVYIVLPALGLQYSAALTSLTLAVVAASCFFAR